MSFINPTFATPIPAGAERPTGPAIDRHATMRSRAEALETAFLAEMLKAAGTTRMSSGLAGSATGGGEGSPDAQAFEPFLAEAQARALMAAGGLGLTEPLVAALETRRAGGAA